MKKEPIKSGAGRPPLRSSDETLDILINAAVEEYRKNGYAKSTMGAIAKRAGISLRTLYKFVSDKEALFLLAAERRLSQNILKLDTHSAVQDATPKEALVSLTRAYAYQVLNRETVLTTKLVIAESDKFPELAKAYLESTKRIGHAFDHNFARIASALAIELSDQETELVRLMLIGSQRSATLSSSMALNDREIDALADRAVEFVLRGKI